MLSRAPETRSTHQASARQLYRIGFQNGENMPALFLLDSMLMSMCRRLIETKTRPTWPSPIPIDRLHPLPCQYRWQSTYWLHMHQCNTMNRNESVSRQSSTNARIQPFRFVRFFVVFFFFSIRLNDKTDNPKNKTRHRMKEQKNENFIHPFDVYQHLCESISFVLHSSSKRSIDSIEMTFTFTVARTRVLELLGVFFFACSSRISRINRIVDSTRNGTATEDEQKLWKNPWQNDMNALVAVDNSWTFNQQNAWDTPEVTRIVQLESWIEPALRGISLLVTVSQPRCQGQCTWSRDPIEWFSPGNSPIENVRPFDRFTREQSSHPRRSDILLRLLVNSTRIDQFFGSAVILVCASLRSIVCVPMRLSLCCECVSVCACLWHHRGVGEKFTWLNRGCL